MNQRHPIPAFSWRYTLAAGLVLLGASVGQAFAYAPEGDLMKIKGYSPEVIETATIQRSRQEWKSPSTPTKSPTERFFHNIYYGQWISPVDDFGSSVLRGN